MHTLSLSMSGGPRTAKESPGHGRGFLSKIGAMPIAYWERRRKVDLGWNIFFEIIFGKKFAADGGLRYARSPDHGFVGKGLP